MRGHRQLIISACATPAFAFIAAQRLASGSYWAAMWCLLTLAHGYLFIDALRSWRTTRKLPT